MEAPTEAFPLAWPAGWKRTTQRKSAKFSKGRGGVQDNVYHGSERLTISQGTQRVLSELQRMGFNHSIVISSNLALRNDGLPRSGQRAPDDPGVAVYWGTGKQARCIAVDRYDRIADNLAAIAATLDAMRAIARHGGAAILDRAFTGFTALPAPEQPWQVLGLTSSSPSRAQIDEAYKRLAMQHHPDRGGDQQAMARINTARDDLYQRMQPQ